MKPEMIWGSQDEDLGSYEGGSVEQPTSDAGGSAEATETEAQEN